MPLDWQLNCTTVAIQGFPISPAPPVDDQVLTWDGTDWVARPTQIPDTVMNFLGTVAAVGDLPTTGDITGDVWWVAGSDQFYMWDGTAWVPLSPPVNTVPFPEAPTTGETYGRDGQSASWNPVLLLAGGTLTGSLILSGPPDPAGDANQAATMGWTNSQIQSSVTAAVRYAAQFLGTYDAFSNIVTTTPQTGIPTGPLPPAATVPGAFVVTLIAGTIPAGPVAGTVMLVGDWLVSDGTNWTPIHVNGSGSGQVIFAADVQLNPVVNTWTNVQQAIDSIGTTLPLLAPLASPSFTGTPTTPDPPVGSDDQTIPNTSWVNAAIAAYVASWALAEGVLTDVTTSGDVESI